jgi:hypothetical protein
MAIALAVASVGIDVGTRLPDERGNETVTRSDVAATALLDRSGIGRTTSVPQPPSLTFTNRIADAARFTTTVTEGTAWDPLTMAMAVIGLMTIIAHRRRVL